LFAYGPDDNSRVDYNVLGSASYVNVLTRLESQLHGKKFLQSLILQAYLILTAGGTGRLTKGQGLFTLEKREISLFYTQRKRVDI